MCTLTGIWMGIFIRILMEITLGILMGVLIGTLMGILMEILMENLYGNLDGNFDVNLMGIFMEILMIDSMGWPYDSSDCLLLYVRRLKGMTSYRGLLLGHAEGVYHQPSFLVCLERRKKWIQHKHDE